MIRRLGGPGMHGIGGMALSGLGGKGYVPDPLTRILSTGPAVCIPVWDESGTTATDVSGNGRHGQYESDVGGWVARDTDLGISVPYWDGAKGCTLLPGGTDLATCCDWDQFSYMVYCKATAGSWTDGLLHLPARMESAAGPSGINRHYHMGSNAVANNQIDWRSYFNGDDSEIIHAPFSRTDWYGVLVTVDRSGNAFKVYIDNAQIGATQAITKDWTQASLSSAYLGASNATGGNGWLGWLAYFTLWNKVLTEAERNKVFF